MSRRRMFLASMFVTAALAVFIIISLWYPLAAIYGLCAALTGALIARFVAPQKIEMDDESLAPSFVELETKAALREAKEALSASAMLQATMDSMREGMLMVDDSLRVIASNPAAQNLFHEAAEHASAKRLSEWTRNPLVHDAFHAALEQGERVEVKVELNGHERRTYDLRVAPLRSRSGGGAHGALGIFFDITRLERLERVRQEFLSNVSHELRTPLTAIKAFTETLEDGAIDDATNNRRFLSVIRRNADRMHNLIDDILELSAIEAGIVKVEPKLVRLYTLIEEVNTSLASQAQAKEVTLRNEVARDVEVFAEARRLEQIMTNLIGNAIKFNRRGGTVRISHEMNESHDRISVTDTGEGIPPEHLPRIFERFYRVDRARSREMGGTGLGLAIVKHLVRAHGGEARVESELGHGASFIIELPQQVRSQNDE